MRPPLPVLEGRAVVLGSHVDTDMIVPARRCLVSRPAQLAPFCFEDLGLRLEPGAILLAGWAFGRGSSREHAVQALLGAGVRAVVAWSAARIFYRNAANRGLLVLETGQRDWAGLEGLPLRLDLEGSLLTAPGTELRAPLPPQDPTMLAMMLDGGALAWRRSS